MARNTKLNTDILNGFSKILFWEGNFNIHPQIERLFGDTESLLGYTTDEILCLSGQILSLIHDEDIITYKKLFTEKANDKQSKSFEYTYRLRRKDKEVKWVKEEISFKRNKDGNLILIAGVLFDITDFKLQEAEYISKAENLAHLNSSKDRFISILSHDLRAPFTSILGFSEILLTETSISESERNEYLNYIHESSNNQLQLINYLLDWSKLQTGKIKIDPTRLNAQLVAHTCVSSLTGNAIRKGIEIKVNIPDNLYIYADERLISQVITNLLSNAIKFSPEQKKIDISAEIFNDHLVEFIIKDEGLGIPDYNIGKIFKVDKMFTTEGTKGEKGTGLGLSLVKEIIDKHKGDIWFYSKQDEGSEFHFTVPLSKSKLLIVEEDKKLSSRLSECIMENYDEFEIIEKTDGYDAISFIGNAYPDLVIIDDNIPFMNGVQFVRHLREKEKAKNVPVIVLIESLDKELRQSYLEYGVHTFLRKPVDLSIFRRELSTLLD